MGEKKTHDLGANQVATNRRYNCNDGINNRAPKGAFFCRDS